MANKKEREKQMQDKIQIILSDLLKDDDNKYCVDCDGKGPRWASWSLGIFLCIRCAGIHRNLGVHISRVKSVNLDSWTPQQVAMMKEIGNSRGRAIYEANLDDNFRRPQTDTTLEQFIRAKYEHKRYIAKEWIPPNPSADIIADDIRKLEYNLHKNRNNYSVNNSTNVSVGRRNVDSQATKAEVSVSKPDDSNKKVDLLGLDTITTASSTINNDDAFGDFVFAPQQPPLTAATATSTTSTSANTTCAVSSAVDDLMGLHILCGPSNNNTMPSNGLASSMTGSGSFSNGQTLASMGTTGGGGGVMAGAMDKNSILALYHSNGGGNMTTMTQAAPSWPGIGVPQYQQQYNQQGGSGTQWAPQVDHQQVAAGGNFGTQHNPFFNNISFPSQHQPTFPAAVSGQTQQQPNSILW